MNQMQKTGKFSRVLKISFKSKLNTIAENIQGGFMLSGLEREMKQNVYKYFEVIKAKHSIQKPSIKVTSHNSSIIITLCDDGVVLKPITLIEFCSILGVMPILAVGIPKKINQYLISEAEKLTVPCELPSLVMFANDGDISLQLDLGQGLVKVIFLKDFVHNL